MKNLFSGKGLLAAFTVFAWIFFRASPCGAEEVNLKLMPAGASARLGGYLPQHIELSSAPPPRIIKAPANLSAPLYGQFKLGPAESPSTFFVIVDEPEDRPAHLFVDANGNGDLTDDPPAEWNAKTNRVSGDRRLVSYYGGAIVQVSYGQETLALRIPMFRFDKNDPDRGGAAKLLFYYGDYARFGEVSLEGVPCPAMLSDRLTTGDFRGGKDARHPAAALFLDLNGDGKFDVRNESFRTDRPFTIAGFTYEISGMTASGGSFRLARIAPLPAQNPSGLGPGQPALAFGAKTTDGASVDFPAGYKGKLVLLDFWATWCGPCLAELPDLTAAYQRFHSRGFEILGVSLDQASGAAQLASFTAEHNMPWPQICDGKLWDAEVAKQYSIDSIPRAFLVDGDSGLIIAAGSQLRGEHLAQFLEQVLVKKYGR